MKNYIILALTFLFASACSSSPAKKGDFAHNSSQPVVNRDPAAMDQLTEAEVSAMPREQLNVREKLSEISTDLPTTNPIVQDIQTRAPLFTPWPFHSYLISEYQ